MRLHALALVLLSISLPTFAAEPYAKVAEVQVGGIGRFDLMGIDSAGHRLYLSHGTEAVVIDTSTNKVVGRIENTPGIHGIAVAPELGLAFTTNGGENKLGIVDVKTLQTKSKVDTGANPDALLYESTMKQVWTFNHTGKSVTIVDAVQGTVVATTALSGQAELGAADATLGKVFVNLEDTNSIAAIDMMTHAVLATYPVEPATGPTGLAIDTASHHLFVGGGEGNALVMLDARNGKVLASIPICKGTDSTAFDAGTNTVFVACGDGHIMAITEKGDTLTVTQTIDTARGARTMIIDPVTHRLYTAAAEFLPADPAKPNARPQMKEDSLKVLVYGAGK